MIYSESVQAALSPQEKYSGASERLPVHNAAIDKGFEFGGSMFAKGAPNTLQQYRPLLYKCIRQSTTRIRRS